MKRHAQKSIVIGNARGATGVPLAFLLALLCVVASGCQSMVDSAFETADLNQRTHDYEERGMSSDRARGNAVYDQMWQQSDDAWQKR